MKISNAEINAANYALTELLEKPLDLAIMEHALIAALKVRKARKQAKRERQREEKDKHVVESVTATSLFAGQFGEDNWEAERAKAWANLSAAAAMSSPSKAPLTVLQLAEDEQ